MLFPPIMRKHRTACLTLAVDGHMQPRFVCQRCRPKITKTFLTKLPSPIGGIIVHQQNRNGTMQLYINFPQGPYMRFLLLHTIFHLSAAGHICIRSAASVNVHIVAQAAMMPPTTIPPRPAINLEDFEIPKHNMLIPPIHRRSDNPNGMAWLSSPVGGAVIAGSVLGFICSIALIYIVCKVIYPQYRFKREWSTAIKRRKEDPNIMRQYEAAKFKWKAQGKKGKFPKPPSLTTLSDMESGQAGPSQITPPKRAASLSSSALARLKQHAAGLPRAKQPADPAADRARARLAKFGNPLGSHPVSEEAGSPPVIPEEAPGSSPFQVIPIESQEKTIAHIDKVKGPDGGLRFFGEYSPQAKTTPAISTDEDPRAGYLHVVNQSFEVGEDSGDDEPDHVID